MTPRHRQEMINGVAKELNRVYSLYKKKNPNFSGKVSIYGHSLGSLLSFDLLSHQHERYHSAEVNLDEPEMDLSDMLQGLASKFGFKRSALDDSKISFPKLNFDVHHFYGTSLVLFSSLSHQFSGGLSAWYVHGTWRKSDSTISSTRRVSRSRTSFIAA